MSENLYHLSVHGFSSDMQTLIMLPGPIQTTRTHLTLTAKRNISSTHCERLVQIEEASSAWLRWIPTEAKRSTERSTDGNQHNVRPVSQPRQWQCKNNFDCDYNPQCFFLY